MLVSCSTLSLSFGHYFVQSYLVYDKPIMERMMVIIPG